MMSFVCKNKKFVVKLLCVQHKITEKIQYFQKSHSLNEFNLFSVERLQADLQKKKIFLPSLSHHMDNYCQEE